MVVGVELRIVFIVEGTVDLCSRLELRIVVGEVS